MSEITGTNIDISDTTIGMTLYQKKPEFGPANIDVSNVNLHSFISMDYLIQEDSVMIVDELGYILIQKLKRAFCLRR